MSAIIENYLTHMIFSKPPELTCLFAVVNWIHVFVEDFIYLFGIRVVGTYLIWELLQYIPIMQPNDFIASSITHQSLTTRDPHLRPAIVFHHSLFAYIFYFNFFLKVFLFILLNNIHLTDFLCFTC